MDSADQQAPSQGRAEQHEWLEQLVGEWEFQAEADAGPGQPPEKASGTESVRSIGGLWVLCEGRGEMPGGGPAVTLMTIGYDPRIEKFRASWVGSMMTYMWVYEGSLDSSGRRLTLETEGPSFTVEGQMASYRDEIELLGPDVRTLTSWVQGADGQWRPFMKAEYRRVS